MHGLTGRLQAPDRQRYLRSDEAKMSTEERDYYERRAEAEICLAQQAQHARAVKAHYELASAYLDRVHGDTPSAGPNILST